MKKLILTLLALIPSVIYAQTDYDSEGAPDRDLFGNYIIIRFTNLCATKEEAVAEMNKFKAYCEENTFLKPYAQSVGYFQLKSIEKDKNDMWFGGYCNVKRQKKVLYEMDKKFLEFYCSTVEIYQFKQMVKNEFCFDEKDDKKGKK